MTTRLPTMTKFREYYNKMLAAEPDEFAHFRQVHDRYALDPTTHQEEYNQAGKKIQYIIRHWEDLLCNRSEGSGYGRYSANLAEKFQNEIRKEFPQIDKIGLVSFNVKKIKLV